MKALLMYKDTDFDLQQKLPWNEQALIQDLELNTLFDAMASGDKFVFEVVKKAILSSLRDVDTIYYRQSILKDCLRNASIVRDIYAITVESIESEKKNYWGIFSNYPDSILRRSVDVLQMFMGMLKRLKTVADEYMDKFESEGFQRFFTMLKEELNDEYFASVQNHLNRLKFKDGVLISAELGKGNKGINYILRKLQDKNQRADDERGEVPGFVTKTIHTQIVHDDVKIFPVSARLGLTARTSGDVKAFHLYLFRVNSSLLTNLITLSLNRIPFK